MSKVLPRELLIWDPDEIPYAINTKPDELLEEFNFDPGQVFGVYQLVGLLRLKKLASLVPVEKTTKKKKAS